MRDAIDLCSCARGLQQVEVSRSDGDKSSEPLSRNWIGKFLKEAIRALNRYISREVYGVVMHRHKEINATCITA